MSNSARKKGWQPEQPWSLRGLRGLFRYLGPVFPGMLTPLALHLWFSTRRHARPAPEQRALASARAFRFHLDTGEVHAWEWAPTGQGAETSAPLILLAHGWNGRGSQLRCFIPGLLDAGFRVICFDAPGHGDSEGRASSVFAFADAIRHIDAHHGPAVGFVAHSFGVMGALYALRGSGNLRRFVAIASPPDFDQLVDGFAGWMRLPEGMVRRMRDRLTRRFGEDLAEQVSPRRNAARMSAEGLVVHDREDATVPIAAGRSLAASLNDRGELLETTGLGHGRILRNPAVVTRAAAFLAGAASSAPSGRRAAE